MTMLANIPSSVANPVKCNCAQTAKEQKKERFILVNDLLFLFFFLSFFKEYFNGIRDRRTGRTGIS